MRVAGRAVRQMCFRCTSCPEILENIRRRRWIMVVAQFCQPAFLEVSDVRLKKHILGNEKKSS